MKHIFTLTVFIFFTLSAGSKQAAADILETQGLSFGTFSLADNEAAYSLEVSPFGTVTHDPQIELINAPMPAVFDMAGFSPLTQINVHASIDDLAPLENGETLSLTAPFISPVVIITDAEGAGYFNIGATLRTSGTGGIYAGKGYTGALTVFVHH